MTHLAYGFGVVPGMSPLKTPITNANVQNALQQATASGAQAAALCSDATRFNTLALQQTCIETVQDPAAAGLSPDQLLTLSKAKLQCHTFFDSVGLDAAPDMLAQCITGPKAFLQTACADPRMQQLPACQAALATTQGFFAAHKTPIIIGGVALAALLAWRLL